MSQQTNLSEAPPMAENSKIEWCNHTFNPWWGCQKVSPGCDNCYAETLDRRTGGGHWGPGAARRVTGEANWKKPLVWNRKAEKDGTRPKVFCGSMCDIGDNAVPEVWRVALCGLIMVTPHLDWLLLTKRPQNLLKFYPRAMLARCWIGTTAENQQEAERRIPHLLATPAAVRFLSCEPLLGPLDIQWALTGTACDDCADWGENEDGPCEHPHPEYHNRLAALDTAEHAARPTGAGLADIGSATINWVIAGGESGPNARPMHPDWARSLRDQCQAAGVPFFFKQWGEYLPVYDRDNDDPDWKRCDHVQQEHQPGQWWNMAGGQGFHGERVHFMKKVGKRAAGRLLDSIEHNAFPTTNGG